MLRYVFVTACFLVLSIGQSMAKYPEKPVRLIVNTPPGTSIDIIARLMASQFTDKFGQPFVVINKSGAQGLIAMKEVITAPPDGYTLHLAGSIAAINSTTAEGAGIADQLAYISLVRRSPTYLGMSTKRGFGSFNDLVEFGKKNPGTLNYGSLAKVLELYTVSISRAVGVKAVHVAFRGSMDASSALAAGEIDYYLDSANIIENLEQRGQAKMVAATSAERSKDRPDIPSLPEVGVKGLDLVITYGLVGPKGTPDEIVRMLSDGVRAFAATKEAAEGFLKLGQGVPVSSTPEEFQKQVRDEIKTIESAAQFVGLKLQ